MLEIVLCVASDFNEHSVTVVADPIRLYIVMIKPHLSQQLNRPPTDLECNILHLSANLPRHNRQYRRLARHGGDLRSYFINFFLQQVLSVFGILAMEVAEALTVIHVDFFVRFLGNLLQLINFSLLQLLQ